jgi:hypothetical protein
MALLFRTMIVAVLLFLGACSMKTAIDRMSSADDRAFAQRFVDAMRTGTIATLRPNFDESLWADSVAQFPQARSFYPVAKGETQLVGYNVFTNIGNGVTETSKQYTMVTNGQGHWTRTVLVTRALGDREKIVGWNVEGFSEPPPELKIYESMEAAIPWLRAGAVMALLLVTALVAWLVHRSRRRRAA